MQKCAEQPHSHAAAPACLPILASPDSSPPPHLLLPCLCRNVWVQLWCRQGGGVAPPGLHGTALPWVPCVRLVPHPQPPIVPILVLCPVLAAEHCCRAAGQPRLPWLPRTQPAGCSQQPPTVACAFGKLTCVPAQHPTSADESCTSVLPVVCNVSSHDPSFVHPWRADKPLILHYGRLWEVGAWKYQKHWFRTFQALQVRQEGGWGRAGFLPGSRCPEGRVPARQQMELQCS